MSKLVPFFNYVMAFEEAFLTNDWTKAGACFTPDARHVVHAPEPLKKDVTGNTAICDRFRQELDALDRRFDLRIPEVLEGPYDDGNGVWMRWGLEFRRRGLPSLHIEGDHRAIYDGDRIASLTERVTEESGPRVAKYLAEHADLLHPVGGSPQAGPVVASPVVGRSVEGGRVDDSPQEAGPDEAGLIAASEALQRSIIRFYGAAKSRADVDGALCVCTEDFAIDTIPFGIVSADKNDTRASLQAFFAGFPDYSASIEGFASSPTEVAAWGTVRMTPDAAVLGLPTSGGTAELPFSCIFGMDGPLLRSERFFFDLVALCEQTGMPLDDFRAVLTGLRAGTEDERSRVVASGGPGL